MSIIRVCLCVAAALPALIGPMFAQDQADDVFAFIPTGGKTLLTEVADGAPADEVHAIITGERSRDAWARYLEDRKATLPALGDLARTELMTLANYLSFAMPLPAAKVPADPGAAEWDRILPADGRDLTLNNCQFCHIITVVVTQEKPQAAWLGTMHKPSHIEIDLTEKERELIASYLVLNGAIPVDLVPEELRAGGASY